MGPYEVDGDNKLQKAKNFYFSGALSQEDEIGPLARFFGDDINEEEFEEALKIAKSISTEPSEPWVPPQPSSDSTVWRYLDFTQLMSIIERDSIWFSNIGAFDDPYEGSAPHKNVENTIKKIKQQADTSKMVAERAYKLLVAGNNHASNSFVNCWNLNNHESAALWEQYINSSEGVAISTTVNKLEKSLRESNENLIFGKIEYINYETDEIPRGTVPTLYHKRKSFEHENEFRISFVDEEDISKSGTYVNVDVNMLLDKIYLSPTSKKWFSDQVKKVLDTYGVECELVKSDILSDPVY